MSLILGLIFDIIGVLILILVNILDYPHHRIFNERWQKKYWWMCWRPLYTNTETLKWKMKLSRKVIKHGFLPPKHLWTIIGFLFIFCGFILQLKSFR